MPLITMTRLVVSSNVSSCFCKRKRLLGLLCLMAAAHLLFPGPAVAEIVDSLPTITLYSSGSLITNRTKIVSECFAVWSRERIGSVQRANRVRAEWRLVKT